MLKPVRYLARRVRRIVRVLVWEALWLPPVYRMLPARVQAYHTQLGLTLDFGE